MANIRGRGDNKRLMEREKATNRGR